MESATTVDQYFEETSWPLLLLDLLFGFVRMSATGLVAFVTLFLIFAACAHTPHPAVFELGAKIMVGISGALILSWLYFSARSGHWLTDSEMGL